MESMFQFTNPALTGLEFGLNEGFNSKENKEVQIQINMSVSVNRNESRNEAEVTLKIELGEKSPEMPFFITALEAARFRWGEELEEALTAEEYEMITASTKFRIKWFFLGDSSDD